MAELTGPDFSKNELIPAISNVYPQVKQNLQDNINRFRESEKLYLYAVNELNNKELPIYVADFALGNVGTGCLVGVPGHDMRDFEFAQAMKLPVVRVVVGADGDTSEITDVKQVQEETGTMVNSGFLDGMEIHAATEKIMDYMEEKGYGKQIYPSRRCGSGTKRIKTLCI